MRWSLDSTNRAHASSEILPSNSHVDAMFNGWPSRSRYRKNVSPHERERIRSAVDIVVSLASVSSLPSARQSARRRFLRLRSERVTLLPRGPTRLQSHEFDR